MKVKTDYVPSEVRGYLTPGKVYECFNVDPVGADITNDNGLTTCICFRYCAHLDAHDWTIVEG